MPVRRKTIRSIVDRLLIRHSIDSKPIDLDRIADALGVEVRREPAPDELSGFIIRDTAHQKVLIGINSRHHKVRQRFTLAHEIGHFLLHEGERVHVDRTDRIFYMKKRNERSREGTDIEEIEANVFAAELLMPASFIERDLDRIGPIDPLGNEDTLKKLAKEYGVSYQAFLFRVANLGYVNLE
jgi:Zn-dependent peptidase ImmA (M78 family)